MLSPSPERLHELLQIICQYLEGAAPEIRVLLEHYTVSDVIRRVVGVGSVGTRCALTLLQDGDGNAFILQSNEAGRSVLEQYGGIAQPQPLDDDPFGMYARACGVILARAHVQSPRAAVVSGYLGRGRRFGEAMWEWGNAYADRAEADHAAFVARTAERAATR